MTEQEIHEYLKRRLTDIAGVLASDPVLAKAEIQKRVSRLVLEPTEVAEGKAYRITGDLRLFCSNDEVVMLDPSLSRLADHYSSLSLPIDETVFCPAQTRLKKRTKRLVAPASPASHIHVVEPTGILQVSDCENTPPSSIAPERDVCTTAPGL